MDSPLEEVAFFSRSENRVQVLETLATEPRDRRDLQDALGASRATMARILSELEEHHYITRCGDHYEITTLGELVLTDFTSLLETIATVQQLRDVIHLFPADGLEIDLHHFRTAEILIPDEANPMDHMDRGLGLLRAAERVQVLANTALLQFVAVISDRIQESNLEFECVVPERFIDRLPDQPRLETSFRAMVRAGGTVHQYAEYIPYNLFIADETVFLWLCSGGPEKTEQAALVSTDEVVRSWAEATYDAYRDSAEPITLHNLVRSH